MRSTKRVDKLTLEIEFSSVWMKTKLDNNLSQNKRLPIRPSIWIQFQKNIWCETENHSKEEFPYRSMQPNIFCWTFQSRLRKMISFTRSIENAGLASIFILDGLMFAATVLLLWGELHIHLPLGYLWGKRIRYS